jgi:hypothetical protein
MLNYFRKQADSGLKLLGLIAIIVVAAYLVFRFVDMKIIEKRTLEENNIIFDKLRSTAKLVVWEQDFKLMNITSTEKKYFGSDMLKFTEKVSTTAKGRIGFHIDLGDTINTSITITAKAIEVHAPLRLTYVSIDNSSIEQIKESSYDPSVEIDKEAIVKRLNEMALREYLKPALEKAKKQSLEKQERSLTALTGKPVKIIITDMPTLESSMNWLNRNN